MHKRFKVHSLHKHFLTQFLGHGENRTTTGVSRPVYRGHGAIPGTKKIPDLGLNSWSCCAWSPAGLLCHWWYSELQNVRAARLPFQPSHLFVLSTAKHQHLPKWAPPWFNFSKPYLHTLTSPFPRIKMVWGGHWRHIPEPVKGIFVTMSRQMSSKDILIQYIWHWSTPQTNTCLSSNRNRAALSFHNQL